MVDLRVMVTPANILHDNNSEGPLCQKFPPYIWESDKKGDKEFAKIVCSECPVIDWCRDLSDEAEADIRPADIRSNNQIWAGESPDERIRRRRRRIFTL